MGGEGAISLLTKLTLAYQAGLSKLIEIPALFPGILITLFAVVAHTEEYGFGLEKKNLSGVMM